MFFSAYECVIKSLCRYPSNVLSDLHGISICIYTVYMYFCKNQKLNQNSWGPLVWLHMYSHTTNTYGFTMYPIRIHVQITLFGILHIGMNVIWGNQLSWSISTGIIWFVLCLITFIKFISHKHLRLAKANAKLNNAKRA